LAIQATADQGFIRKHNTAVVLDGLRRFAPLSRVELAARTGLNHSTVSLIINKLIKEGFIKEAYLQRPKIGRPGMVLVLNPKGGFTVGIERWVRGGSSLPRNCIGTMCHSVRWRSWLCWGSWLYVR
jgi:hypothetical protein